MTLPAQKRDPFPPASRGRTRAAERELADRLRERITQAENAAKAAAAAAQERLDPPQPKRSLPVRDGFSMVLLAWSCLALAASIGILAWETVGPGAVVRSGALRPTLDFADVSTRYVQSNEGPAIEMTGIVRNSGEDPVAPEVTLQLSGTRIAIEEPLRLGSAPLPPRAERPFAVRLLLPEGATAVKLLPTPMSERGGAPVMPLVSPAWTAETPGF